MMIAAEQVTTFESTMSRADWQIVGKLQEQQVIDLHGHELARAFAYVGAPTFCHRVARKLIRRGLTIEMLNVLGKADSTATTEPNDHTEFVTVGNGQRVHAWQPMTGYTACGSGGSGSAQHRLIISQPVAVSGPATCRRCIKAMS